MSANTESVHDLALQTIEHLDAHPDSPERARHKLNMIRIAERDAAGIDYDHQEALQQVIAAASWAG